MGWMQDGIGRLRQWRLEKKARKLVKKMQQHGSRQIAQLIKNMVRAEITDFRKDQRKAYVLDESKTITVRQRGIITAKNKNNIAQQEESDGREANLEQRRT